MHPPSGLDETPSPHPHRLQHPNRARSPPSRQQSPRNRGAGRNQKDGMHRPGGLRSSIPRGVISGCRYRPGYEFLPMPSQKIRCTPIHRISRLQCRRLLWERHRACVWKYVLTSRRYGRAIPRSPARRLRLAHTGYLGCRLALAVQTSIPAPFRVGSPPILHEQLWPDIVIGLHQLNEMRSANNSH